MNCNTDVSDCVKNAELLNERADLSKLLFRARRDAVQRDFSIFGVLDLSCRSVSNLPEPSTAVSSSKSMQSGSRFDRRKRGSMMTVEKAMAAPEQQDTGLDPDVRLSVHQNSFLRDRVRDVIEAADASKLTKLRSHR